ncbi:MAG: hypothetical protein ACOX6I_06135 [Syntrophomonadaceae bacterium]
MKLDDSDIISLLYESPWLLDNRYVISDISGSQGKGRKVNVGRNGFSREIELLFKDTRDNRPVIVEIHKSRIDRDDVARILEYRSLVASMDENLRSAWQTEFGPNFFSPKLLLIGTEANEEVIISANLAGIEIRLLKGLEALELNFAGINQIAEKLTQWDKFLKSGNRTIIDRNQWVEEIYAKIRHFVDNYGNEDIATISSLCRTSLKNSYVRGQAFPFLNIPIRYQDKELLGFYEYCNSELCFDEHFIYCDFIIEPSYYSTNKDDQTSEITVSKAKAVLKQRGYEIIAYENGMATIKIDRTVLEQDEEFQKLLKKLTDDAIDIQKEVIMEI